MEMRNVKMQNAKMRTTKLKILEFVGLRALEIAVLYFLYRFVSGHFDGFYAYAILGAAVFVYLFFVIGCYVDDHREAHRYDDVVF